MRVLTGALKGKTWIAGSSVHGCWLGSYEFEKQQLFVKVLESLEANSTIFDVGANVGFYSMLSATVLPSSNVYAFEPLPRNIDFLRRHIALNKFENIKLIPSAVGSVKGTALFDDSTNPSMGALSPDGKTQVEVVCVDDLLSSGFIRVPDLIKMDIEGGEIEALKGMQNMLKNQPPKAIFLSTHGSEIHDTCCKILTSSGFVLISINDNDELIAVHPQFLKKLPAEILRKKIA